MGAAKLSVMLLYSIVCVILVMLETCAADYEVVDEFVQRRWEQARKASLQNYHPLPHHLVHHFNYQVHLATNETMGEVSETNNNDTRRMLKNRPYKGPCMATNPIDRCWRCRRNWATDRKRLARCGLGFGRNTTGGMAGNFYVVTDPSDSDVQNPKPGTLRHAVIQKQPLWIIFAKSMTIKLQQELLISSDKTIDGRGAQVRISQGAGLTIQFVQNVIIHNIKISDIVATSGALIRDSVDHIGVRTASDGDGISVFGSTNVWIDHISMSNCKDGLIDVIQESTAITISNCHMTRHDDVMLFGASDSHKADEIMQVTVAFNHFGKGLVQRMPRCRFGFFHVVNNDYTHWLMYAIGGSSHPTIVSQGNRFIAPPNPKANMVAHRIYATESEWRQWSWTSQEDLLLNGAVFIQSGSPPPPSMRYNREMIKPKPGSYVRRLARFAGHLTCKIGRKC